MVIGHHHILTIFIITFLLILLESVVHDFATSVFYHFPSKLFLVFTGHCFGRGHSGLFTHLAVLLHQKLIGGSVLTRSHFLGLEGLLPLLLVGFPVVRLDGPALDLQILPQSLNLLDEVASLAGFRPAGGAAPR